MIVTYKDYNDFVDDLIIKKPKTIRRDGTNECRHIRPNFRSKSKIKTKRKSERQNKKINRKKKR